MERERCGPPLPSRPPRARRPRRAGRGRDGSPAGAGRGRGGPPAEAEMGAAEEAGGRGHVERERCGREKRGGRGQMAKLSFYLASQLKMSSLLDVVCGRLNDSFAVCCEQIRVWWCALHKIMLSQCPVDKFPKKIHYITKQNAKKNHTSHQHASVRSNIYENRLTPGTKTSATGSPSQL